MKRSHLLVALAILPLWLLPGLAPAEPVSQRQEVETLFRLTQMKQKIDDSVNSVAQLQLQQNPQLQAQREELVTFLNKYIGWEAIREELTGMYLQTFTE